MSLTNFSLPFSSVTPSPFAYTGQDSRSVMNNFRFNAILPLSSFPEYNQETTFRNDPYVRYHHQHLQQNQQRQQYPQHQQKMQHTQHQQQERHQQTSKQLQNPQQQQQQTQQATNEHHRLSLRPIQEIPTRVGFSPQDPDYSDYDQGYQRIQLEPEQKRPSGKSIQEREQQQRLLQDKHLKLQMQQQQLVPHQQKTNRLQSPVDSEDRVQDNYPGKPIGYTKVNSGTSTRPGTKTSVHAVIDYDDDDFNDYYDELNTDTPNDANVTPIQGPIFMKNGTVPVVPLYSYPQLNNGTLVQIPILWTALSVALGVELRGDLVKGAPCIKKYHQLFCPTAGNSYPIERIERFIDENKALMKRMYGDFEMDESSPPKENPLFRRKRTANNHDIPDGGPKSHDEIQDDPHAESGDSYFNKIRSPRQSFGKAQNANDSGRVDICESRVEIVTPYWSTNSAGKVRAIVNTQHFEQAIHQEVCSKSQTNKCSSDCGCEQKYKWHRLLAYDPDNDCKGIFMDWFLYPSCCVCRCDSREKFPGTTKTIIES